MTNEEEKNMAYARDNIDSSLQFIQRFLDTRQKEDNPKLKGIYDDIRDGIAQDLVSIVWHVNDALKGKI